MAKCRLSVIAVCLTLFTMTLAGCGRASSGSAALAVDAGPAGVSSDVTMRAAPLSPPNNVEARRRADEEGRRRIDAVARSFTSETMTKDHEEVARRMEDAIRTDYGSEFANVNVTCRTSVCLVRARLLAPEREKPVSQRLARHRAEWAPEFRSLQYVRMNLVDEQVRFIVRKEVPVPPAHG